jgi:hypothetical protein
MQAVVVYESMYGNTHLIADAIAAGLRPQFEVTVVSVSDAGGDVLAGADLVVVGGPTHGRGMSRAVSRAGAADAANKPGSRLTLELGALGPGLRDWFDTVGQHTGKAAAFDTRGDAPAWMSGRACKGIARKLRGHGFDLAAEPASFLVSKENRLLDGEQGHAREWGERLAAACTSPN